ncbi:MAG: hypothetical protein VW989_05550 [Rhodobiaceae bacterium]
MFSAFIGIDWSGARGPRQPGIQIAVASPGRAAPETVLAADGRHWGRDGVHDWLLATAAAATAGSPVLVGIDFAFAHPFVDEDAYYPGLDDSPSDPAALWARVEAECAGDAHLYGGAMFAAPRLGDYYLSPRNHGAPHYRSRRRLTELAARASARAPSPTFKAIGADNVATGSMAGMRLIHALRAALGARLAVWPFDEVTPARALSMVLVEIFPSYYFHRAGFNPARNAAADPAFMNAALAAYDSRGVGPDFTPRGADADEADAIIAAATLRRFAGQGASWTPPPAAAHEGWIFGVPAMSSE